MYGNRFWIISNKEIYEYRHKIVNFLSNYDGTPVLLRGIDQSVLKEILFEHDKRSGFNFYILSTNVNSSGGTINLDFFGNENYIDMKSFYQKIDFSNIDFGDFCISDIDFNGLFGIYLNPYALQDNITNVNFNGVFFTDSFKSYHKLENVSFKGSKNAMIDPDRIFTKKVSFGDVTFLKPFSYLNFRSFLDFTGSHGAVIEPNVQITDSTLYDATLLGDLTNERFKNCTPPIEKIREVYGTDKEMVLVRKEDFH